ncbi:MAG TPA: 4a-hydroxytetrahydrobiopterin dehydratase [Terriglobales bacterium]
MAVLAEKELRQRLSELPGWSYGNNAIEKVFEFKDFAAAMKFVNKVAAAAEQANHHPDIDIRYNKVRMLLTSHDSGGVTARDLRMAKQITDIVAG